MTKRSDRMTPPPEDEGAALLMDQAERQEDQPITYLVTQEDSDHGVATAPDLETVTLLTGFKVSASEKISTGDYENYTPHTSIEGEFEVPIFLDEEAKRQVRQMTMDLHRDLQETLEQVALNRTRIEEHEEWENQR